MDDLHLTLRKPVMRVCACGCGRPATRGDWITGHWNKGKKHLYRKQQRPDSEETKRRKSESAKKRCGRQPKKEIVLKPCRCGCREMVKGTWVRGHCARVENVSKRDDVKKKRSDNFVKLHAEGKIPNWNRGLTKETDPRVATYGQTRSENISDVERKDMSDRMKYGRLSGVIPNLYGSDHPNWKGGVSELTSMLRGSHQLYKLWKRPILERDEFRCQKCNRGTTEVRLAVHHDEERFSEIMHRELKNLVGDRIAEERTWEEKVEICERVIDYHVSQNVSGITLCYDCHEEVHRQEASSDID